MFRVAGLVDGIVACDPGVGDVAFCELGPEPDAAVLVVFVVPEGGVGGGVVGVPVGILAAGDGVHVEDCVDFVFGALGAVSHNPCHSIESYGRGIQGL